MTLPDMISVDDVPLLAEIEEQRKLRDALRRLRESGIRASDAGDAVHHERVPDGL